MRTLRLAATAAAGAASRAHRRSVGSRLPLPRRGRVGRPTADCASAPHRLRIVSSSTAAPSLPTAARAAAADATVDADVTTADSSCKYRALPNAELSETVAEAFFSAFLDAGAPGPVLDVGASAGGLLRDLADEAVADAALPFVVDLPLHATDIEPPTLESARVRGVVTNPNSGASGQKRRALMMMYDHVFHGDLAARLPCADDSYGGVICNAAFLTGHVGTDGLDEVLRVTRPGGVAAVCVDEQHWEAAGFAHKLDSLRPRLSDLRVTMTRVHSPPPVEELPPHDNDCDARIVVFAKQAPPPVPQPPH